MRKFVLAVVALGLGLTATAQAQAAAQANINATARILTALTVNGAQALDFGDVLLSSSKVLPASDPSSGHFTVAGSPNAEVDVDFTFPTTLDDGGGNSLSVGTWTGLEGVNLGRGAAAAFDPNSTFTRRLGTTVGDLLNLYLGGTVTSAGGEPAGTYSNTIQMDVSYTGN